MAQEEEEEVVAVVESVVSETLDQSSQSYSPTSSPSSSDPSLSRNISFSKLNAKAPEFVPTRPQTSQQQQPPPPPPPPRVGVIPPPPPPGVLHIYPPPPPSPFHVPIHSPVPVSHVIPVQNHHPHHHHHSHHPHHHHNNHHQQQQHYVPVRNHNNHHQNSHYVAVQYHQNNYGPDSKKVQPQEEEEEAAGGKKDVASSDHAFKNEKSERTGLPDEAMQKLVNQVEYYFSDVNLATTDHLMRFITKDPDGYVPLSVVASFKKVKAVINSHSQLATILRNSSKLEVSEDGKKVRRLHPLTESDVEELQSRIIVAENLPEDHCHQNLMKIFSAVGSVKTIRTCPPQASGGGALSASRSGKADGMHFSNKLHAFVEYESVDIAEKAAAELNDEGNWRSGLRVRLMLKRMSKDSKATHVRGKKGHDGQGHSEEDEVSTSEHLNEKHAEDPLQQYDVHFHEQSAPGEDHANDKEGAHKKGRNRGRGKGRGRGQYHHHNNRGNHVGTPPLNNVVVGEQHPTMAKQQPPGPRMPDGTRGFAMGRGKPVAVNSA